MLQHNISSGILKKHLLCLGMSRKMSHELLYEASGRHIILFLSYHILLVNTLCLPLFQKKANYFKHRKACLVLILGVIL